MIATLEQIKQKRIDFKREPSQGKMVVFVDYGDDHINIIKRDKNSEEGFLVVSKDVADFYKILKQATSEKRAQYIAEITKKYEEELYFDDGIIELIEKGVQKYAGISSEEASDFILCKKDDDHLYLTISGKIVLDVTANIEGENNWKKLLNLQKETKIQFKVEKKLFRDITMLA